MRRLISGNAAPTGDDRAANENSATQEGETHREQEFRYQRDDREEKTAEVNAEDELFGSGHFSLDENTWEGLEAAYNLHLQLAAGTNGLPCPICLRVTQLPVRQDCGHVLCLQCMQQSASAIGGCPLCQTQQFFKVGKNAAPETEMRMMGFAYTATEQDIGNPVNIGTPSGFPSSHSGLFLQADQIQHYGNCSSNSTSVSIGGGKNISWRQFCCWSSTSSTDVDTETPTWVKLQPRGDNPGLSSTHSVCVVKDQMYMFGGYDGKFRRGQLYAFEVEGVFNESIECVWRKVETQGCGPAARYTHCGASIGSQIIVYGGNSGCLKGDAYVLDLGTEIPTWKLAKCEPMLTPRAWHRAVVRSDAMYVFGGRTANGNDNNLVRIALSREIGVNPAA
ncbi:Adagio protein 3 [Phytophthora boehmeriae]|uniref:Adagio protein 3 n=1 Tax=Phytophthora boehmeriae TaxID=109152 RepID=A0A8T1X8Y2_9STRA|nr:Adagio protein 3 [Phytophthora boehmeriae]